ncbi:Uncharacterised protein [Vibrio cholerae]|nr:Uncharacterised protein [Vibrio cholerae]
MDGDIRHRFTRHFDRLTHCRYHTARSHGVFPRRGNGHHDWPFGRGGCLRRLFYFDR